MHWHRGLNPFWPHKFGFKPLLGLEPMAPIRPQLLVSHANNSATETSLCMYVCIYVCMYVCITYVRMCMCVYVCMFVCMCICMYVCITYVCMCECVCMYIHINKHIVNKYTDRQIYRETYRETDRQIRQAPFGTPCQFCISLALCC